MDLDNSQPAYRYRAKIERVIDGDTIVCSIDLGIKTWRHGETLRLLDVNTPEIRGDERERGLEYKDFLSGILPEGTDVIVETHKDKAGKYGRLLARVYVNGECVNDKLNSKLILDEAHV